MRQRCCPPRRHAGGRKERIEGGGAPGQKAIMVAFVIDLETMLSTKTKLPAFDLILTNACMLMNASIGRRLPRERHYTKEETTAAYGRRRIDGACSRRQRC